jgi:3-deoxy-D-manno-octulosonate 8-phosphate phosphatase (KDO 8-P phosphatase)
MKLRIADCRLQIADFNLRAQASELTVERRAALIRLVLFDVDGVLTDGRVVLHGDGSESKQFHIRDGIVMVWAQRVGLKIGLLSARMSASTAERAAQLGITLVHQGVPSKINAYDEIVSDIGLNDEEVAYMGDDIVDIAVLSRVGLAAAPADAVPEVRERVHWLATSAGGGGAARELLELILRAQGRWDPIVKSFTPVTMSSEGDRA